MNGSGIEFDYFYGMESQQFAFYRIPKLLMKDEHFRKVSCDAKLLYGLMLDRMSLSMKNGWFDDQNRAYIIFTIDQVAEELCIGRDKAIKILGELDSKKGIGLVERVRRGQGKPDIIYVKNFVITKAEGIVKPAASEEKAQEVQKSEISTSKSGSFSEVWKTDFKKSENSTSRNREIRPQEVEKSDSNYNNKNYTDKSNTESINQSIRGSMDEMDVTAAYMELIRENIEYDHHMKYLQYGDIEIFEELYQLICELVCVKRKYVQIGGEKYPYALVKSRFLKLNSGHLEYVMDCMKNTTTKINNIKAYMLTALYNATCTINHYYQQEVNHDLYHTG